MERTPKMEAARKALKRVKRKEDAGEVTPQRIQAIREALYRLRSARIPSLGDRPVDDEPPHCKVELDRAIFGCEGLHMDGLLQMPDFRRIRANRITAPLGTFVAYRRVTVLQNRANRVEIRVLSEPNGPNLEPFRIVFIPADDIGLQHATVRTVFNHVQGLPRIALVEVAFDFPCGSGVDSAYVRARALFGKCQPRKLHKLRRRTRNRRTRIVLQVLSQEGTG